MTLHQALSAFHKAGDLLARGAHRQALVQYQLVLAFEERHHERLLEAGLSRSDVLTNMAICAKELGEFQQMLTLTTEVVAVEGVADNWRFHGEALRRAGHLSEALVACAKATRLGRREPACFWERACCLVAAGDVEAALKNVRVAVKLGTLASEVLADPELEVLLRDSRAQRLLQGEHASARRRQRRRVLAREARRAE